MCCYFKFLIKMYNVLKYKNNFFFVNPFPVRKFFLTFNNITIYRLKIFDFDYLFWEVKVRVMSKHWV